MQSKFKIKYGHKVSPQGESFQGFWIEDDSMMVAKPFPTKKDAQVYLGRNIQTWGDLAQFIALRSLPYKVVRFNMSMRSILVDAIANEPAADNLYAAREIVLNTAYETGVVPVPAS
jgi:hypothetical protein